MDAQNVSLSPHEATEIAGHLMAAKMYSLASCVMLFYDIFITFGDEVEKIWKQRFTVATVLWFMNRYISPLGYIVIIVSFHDPDWSKSRCNRYVLYPEALKIVTAAAIGVIFILRLYSIYGRSVIILGVISCLLLAELGVKIWSFTDGTSVNLPPGLVGCILTGRDNSGDRFVFTWVAELIFDTAIFVATFSRTLVIYKRHRRGAAIPLIKIMMRDGIIYFAVIFAANVVTVVLFLVLPDDLKAVNASFSTLITSLMVSRLILNLRAQALSPSTPSFASLERPIDNSTVKMLISSAVVGNLGQPVSSWFDEDDDDDDMGSLYKPPIDDDDVLVLHDAAMTQGTLGLTQELHCTQSHIFVAVTQDVTTDIEPPPAPFLPRLSRLSDPAHMPEPFRQAPTPALVSSNFPRELESPPFSNTLAPLGAQRRPSSARSHACGEERSGVWLPPRTWRIDDGIQLAQLGRSRRSLSS
ncbi:hypothetical protein SCHPADRAFT_946246 [Schizopora paradoxa]|uniref:DUF6533 domain-containing protein n=1 Tax=Schizopora paradoxa TaxID=27342 RepID=A0A0H2R350_9AGAM|nr:hypothetical protein SCHPADRAFT_946246 [Schizopora paradoxa]